MRFLADFEDDKMAPLLLDEPAPLGEGTGPNASRLVAAAAANCLAASLLFCLRKSRVDVKGLHAEVEARLARNEKGRLRIGGLSVTLRPELGGSGAASGGAPLGRCLELFEDFCLVTQSLRQGIPVDVTIEG
jgi:organic hydroperoxide reductase OsmC/OhrA